MLYSLNEIFYSIQGEGRNTGMPAWFIRFAGCNLNCRWCDTDYSKKFYADEEDIIFHNLDSNNCKNIILTGGEPSLQDLMPLLIYLKGKGYYIAIETNGTNSLRRYEERELLDWITVSPKERPLRVDSQINEIKVIWPSSIFQWCGSLESKYHYIQPCDDKNKEANTKEAIDIVKNNPKWRLSLQVQKMIEVR